jgi:hypothetical protein
MAGTHLDLTHATGTKNRDKSLIAGKRCQKISTTTPFSSYFKSRLDDFQFTSQRTGLPETFVEG